MRDLIKTPEGVNSPASGNRVLEKRRRQQSKPGRNKQALMKGTEMRDYISKFQRRVENTDWDDWERKGDKYLEWFCWSVIIVAILYFAPICLKVFLRG